MNVMRSVVHGMVNLWIQVGLILLVLVIIEAGGRAYRRLTYSSRPSYGLLGPGDPTTSPSWFPEYHRELDAMFEHLRWRPYVYWSNPPYRSAYINVDAQGRRYTWRASVPADSGKLIKIFVFGGSTTFGFGARDDYTIPSLLAKGIAQNCVHSTVEVDNEGTIGYVSTQEVIQLLQMLRHGNVPDLVIFYDGINDTEAAFEDGVAGETEGEGHREAEFNVLNPDHPRPLYCAALGNVLLHSVLGELAEGLIASLAPHKYRLMGGRLVRIGESTAQSRKSTDALESAVVSTYLSNKQLVEQLGTKMNFRSIFFWQPVLYTKKIPTRYEMEAESTYVPGAAPFFRAVYSMMAANASNEGIIDLSEVLNRDAREYFVDSEHITENGNIIVARAMLPYVLKIMRADGSDCAVHEEMKDQSEQSYRSTTY